MTATYSNEQPREAISTCPVCEGELRVTRLQCGACGTGIEGRFSVGRFSRLNREQLALLESFLRARGNLRELERELGISYPTVRNRIEALLRALGLSDGEAEGASVSVSPAEPPVDSTHRREILERLARREITAQQAAAELANQPAEATPEEQSND